MAKSGDARKSGEQKPGAQGPSEDMKRKFREALDKKQ